jgi:hypothetical protein
MKGAGLRRTRRDKTMAAAYAGKQTSSTGTGERRRELFRRGEEVAPSKRGEHCAEHH